MVKRIEDNLNPVNVIIGKDKQKGFYIAKFDSKQVLPRVTMGSTWLAHDKRYKRKFLVRVVDINYNDNYDLKQILSMVDENPEQPFDKRSLEYYCAELAWLRLEGEFTDQGIESVADQPTVLQTFLVPTDKNHDLLIAAPDISKGFMIGVLRGGAKREDIPVTLEDRFRGFKTLISGTSGYGKSTLMRNIARHWLENLKYGKVIDDLKGEYIADITNESGETVSGLCHHPLADKNLYLLTAHPEKYEGLGLENDISKVIPLKFSLDDIPPENLEDVAGRDLTQPQKTFLDMYQDRPGLFRTLLRETDGSPDTSDWHQIFKGWIVLSKKGEKGVEKDANYETDPSDFLPSSYTPIHGVIKQLRRLASRPYISKDNTSCLPMLKELLKKGATIILDKSALTDGDKTTISTVIANDLYNHNEKFSSGNKTEQAKVIPFVYIVEEAHLLLSKDKAKEDSVFVNFAKTGRSFQIGLVAVTQRPSSIDTNILSQFDNYITFRLTNKNDTEDLFNAKTDFQGYEGDIRTMGRGAAVIAFGEPTKIQSIQVFEWTQERAQTLLSIEQTQLMKNMHVDDEDIARND
ncbi:MAG: ATP-binding protein [Anaerolineales bacterium]|nr:ATP-binding protein [Anaerolineales bacterium]